MRYESLSYIKHNDFIECGYDKHHNCVHTIYSNDIENWNIFDIHNNVICSINTSGFAVVYEYKNNKLSNTMMFNI